jgi:hypothetical protein
MPDHRLTVGSRAKERWALRPRLKEKHLEENSKKCQNQCSDPEQLCEGIHSPVAQR